jgi:hypothetical protein
MELKWAKRPKTPRDMDRRYEYEGDHSQYDVDHWYGNHRDPLVARRERMGDNAASFRRRQVFRRTLRRGLDLARSQPGRNR